MDTLKEKVRTAETIWNDLEIQNTSLRKQVTAAQQQVQVRHPEYVAQKAACCRVSKFQSIKDSQGIAACSFISPHALGSVIIFVLLNTAVLDPNWRAICFDLCVTIIGRYFLPDTAKGDRW